MKQPETVIIDYFTNSVFMDALFLWKYLIDLFMLVCVGPGRKGGELASAVHSYGKTGDPQMRALVQHILSLVSHPIINFLYRWIYDGELEDTYHEVNTHTHTFCQPSRARSVTKKVSVVICGMLL